MIVEDKYKGRYVNQIVDASDVIYCKVGPDNNTPNIVSNTAQSSNGRQKAQIYVSKNGPAYEIVQS